VGVARIAVPLDRVEAVPNRIRRDISGVAFVTLILALFLAGVITEITFRPLRRLTTAVRQVAGGDFQAPLLPAGKDEIGQLNEAFNQMSVALREQIENLNEEKGKLSAVLSQMSDGVFLVDAQGRVLMMNPAAGRMFEVQPGAMVGRSLVEVVRHHTLVELWQNAHARGEQQTTTLEVSAERLFLQGIATPLHESMSGLTLLLFQDLTRLRRLETVRQDFVSNVSHELRTPLAALKALVETLQEGALEDPPAARRFLERMQVEIDTLTQMVRELLELSRIESGRVPLQRRRCALPELLTPAAERMRLQAERAGLTLQIDCPESLPPVFADPERVEQVLVNLLHNAIKFTGPGGLVRLAARVDGDHATISVSDTGAGIAEKDLPRIFERFYKVDRARSGGGTGLGLSIARHIVEAHGGKIWAESAVGKGSTFWFTLPVMLSQQ
jgi:two-component system phosphate regulon sensor histidine kinase PhoR